MGDPATLVKGIIAWKQDILNRIHFSFANHSRMIDGDRLLTRRDGEMIASVIMQGPSEKRLNSYLTTMEKMGWIEPYSSFTEKYFRLLTVPFEIKEQMATAR